MASRQTIGESPLDALIPQQPVIGSSVDAAEPSRDVAPARESVRAPAAPGTPAVQGHAAKPVAAPPEQCLTFYLCGEEYAIGILQIREIVEYDDLTRVPTTPQWIRGVMNLRGSVIPVIDLAVKFGLPEMVVNPRTCIVIVEVDLEDEKAIMGVMVDEVHRVIDLEPEDVKESPAFGTRVHVDLLLGMAEVGERFIPILDLERVLSKDELLTATAVEQEEKLNQPGEEE